MADPYATGDVGTFVGTVGDARVDPLIWFGLKWGADGAGTPAHLTYSFPKTNAAWLSNYYGQEPFQNFQPFTAAQQTAAKKALGLWAEVANVTFEQVAETSSNVGEIRFGNSAAVTNSPFVAWAYGPYEQPGEAWPENGDVWFDKKYPYNLQLNPGQEGFWTILHEIGHALGLDHPFDDGGSGEPVLFPSYDTDQFTVMTYTPELSTIAYASTPQILDILAIQYIYGANMTTRAGDTVYKFPTTEVNRAIWDAGGIDTLDFSNQGGARVQGTMQEGMFFRFGGRPAYGTSSILGIAYGVTIENVIAGNRGSSITGNDVANRMIGGNGKDEFDALAGDDYLDGRGGNDSLSAGPGSNTLNGGTGNDALYGGFENDTLIGGTGTDVMYAYGGNDYLDGGAGIDEMSGAAGNDTYVVDSALDIVNENLSVDTDDRVRSTISLNLTVLGGGSIEHAELLGAAALTLIGNGSDNELTGNTGANKLDGGIGADTLMGGKGADIYIVNEAGDQIIESIAGAAGGIDTVQSSIDFSLAALVNVEKLVLAAGIAGLDGIGNGLGNTLAGNGFANTLNGGIGKDTMLGGAGDDHYIVDNIGDAVTETLTNAKGGGIDTVESSVTYSLAARANVDHLILTGGANINGTGNTLSNEITGNSANNKLDGGTGNDAVDGDAGNDTLLGGSGNDLLIAGTGTDKATGGAGIDTFVFADASELGEGDTITDFKVGAGGDILDLLDIMSAINAPDDPFFGGYLDFIKSGKNTQIWVDQDGGLDNATLLVTLLNANLTEANTANYLVATV